MKKTLFAAIIIGIAGLGLWQQFGRETIVPVTNFEECLKTGNPVMESYPRQCRQGDQTFTEDIGNELEKTDLIRLDYPRPNQVIQSPLNVKGEARGFWFFEASFPVVLTDWDGLIISQGIATAKSDWMTSEFVPFEAPLTFTVDKNVYSDRGTLILRKDNPSGLPEHDDALEIPVVFARTDKSGVTGLVLIGPICPVMQNPPEPGCDDKPFETTVQAFVKNSLNKSPLAVGQTDKEGRYSLSLPPGEYSLQAVGGKPFPSCGTKDIAIEPDVMSEINLYCDTGIR